MRIINMGMFSSHRRAWLVQYLLISFVSLFAIIKLNSLFYSNGNCLRLSANRIPPLWRDVADGFTVDCATGVPDIRYWPQEDRLYCRNYKPGTFPEEKESPEHRSESFIRIFKQRLWTSGNLSIPVSGPGSLLERTVEMRVALERVVEDIKYALNKNVIRIIDIPCGDMTWMPSFLGNRTDIEYTGVDIVPDLIVKHANQFAMHKNWNFHVHDIAAQPLTESYDLIVSRQLTQHLPTDDSLRVLKHFSESGSRFVLMTTYPSRNNTKPLDYQGELTSRFFDQNLEHAPYSLSPPICSHVSMSQEYTIDYNALWQLPFKQRSDRI